MDIYEVTTDYVEFLRKFEPDKILRNRDDKFGRKFVGIIVQNDKYKYVVPLSSPKYLKDYKIKGYTGKGLPDDFSFISYADRIEMLKATSVPVVYMNNIGKDGKIDVLGKIQCNNMIPVPDSEIKKVDLDGMEDVAYKTLMQKQIQFIRKNADEIIKKHINPVYINRKKNRTDIGYIKNATPNFSLLEEKCEEYQKMKI